MASFQFKRFSSRSVATALALLCGVCLAGIGLAGCGDDSDGVNPEDQLCRGEAGFGARIAGGAEPVEMCVPDQATFAYYIPIGGGQARYEIAANFTTGGVTIEILVHFYVQPTYPMTLTLTANAAQADSDPGSVWFYYQETKEGGYDYVGVSVTGVFTVTFNDDSIAVAYFSGLEIVLEDNSTGDPAGVRTISEGFVNVSED